MITMLQLHNGVTATLNGKPVTAHTFWAHPWIWKYLPTELCYTIQANAEKINKAGRARTRTKKP